MYSKLSLLPILLLGLSTAVNSQSCPATPNPLPAASSFPRVTYLPDPFVYLDGKSRVQTRDEWYQCRQPEILRMLQHYQYGFYPDHTAETVTSTRSGNTLAITVTAGGKTGRFNAQVNLPSGASASNPVPVVIAIGGIDNNAYLREGIAVVTFDYTSVAPDSNGKNGAFWALYNGRDIGVLTAWAWGFHRTLDAIEQRVSEINPTKVGVTGCSRLGKAALAAGIFDTRITLTMPMSSGVQGLGPYRYYTLSGQGENLENSKQGAGWWTSSGLNGFLNNHEKLPFDAHTIAAALAPRALIIEQGSGDPFVNSRGTAVAVFPAAKLVYDWLGAGDKIGIAIRNGGHCDFAGYSNVVPFVNKILKGTSTTRDFTNLSPWSAMPTAYPWSSNIPRN
ncbi:hypothetical protein BJ508DRAFT_318029 [Ascobolus immersus RN42]|uniref:(4-O-methyl)-D-glucuronate--lignin esterase n=1 Tax=Ascobolus immersus RN42 TaxID=1160509 RepID=A0A3N4IF83_ASCIM|nr:hypothetical protein BJ508DRAFT_318029 [Ascobolus immersus RN42]